MSCGLVEIMNEQQTDLATDVNDWNIAGKLPRVANETRQSNDKATESDREDNDLGRISPWETTGTPWTIRGKPRAQNSTRICGNTTICFPLLTRWPLHVHVCVGLVVVTGFLLYFCCISCYFKILMLNLNASKE